MATTQTVETAMDSGPRGGFRPFRLTIDRYERLARSGVYPEDSPIFLWQGRLVEKIREGVEPTPDGNYPEHRMSVDRFLRLIEAGVFDGEDRVFLWQGRLVEEMTKGRPHTVAQLSLQDILKPELPPGYHLEIEAPLAVGESSLPEPDLAVIRGAIRDYLIRPPSGRDAALVIEVADSSVAIDSLAKLRAYAAEGIPVYWIVNIPGGRIEVYWDPTGPNDEPSYREHRHYGPDDEVPVVLHGREVGRIPAREVFP